MTIDNTPCYGFFLRVIGYYTQSITRITIKEQTLVIRTCKTIKIGVENGSSIHNFSILPVLRCGDCATTVTTSEHATTAKSRMTHRNRFDILPQSLLQSYLHDSTPVGVEIIRLQAIMYRLAYPTAYILRRENLTP